MSPGYIPTQKSRWRVSSFIASAIYKGIIKLETNCQMALPTEHDPLPTGFDMKIENNNCGQWIANDEQKGAFSEYIVYLAEKYEFDWRCLCKDGTIWSDNYRVFDGKKQVLPKPYTTLSKTFTFTIDTTRPDRPTNRYLYCMTRHFKDKMGGYKTGRARVIDIKPLFGGYVPNILYVKEK